MKNLKDFAKKYPWLILAAVSCGAPQGPVQQSDLNNEFALNGAPNSIALSRLVYISETSDVYDQNQAGSKLCRLESGVYQLLRAPQRDGERYRLDFVKEPPECASSSGFVPREAVWPQEFAFTVSVPTIFKREARQSDQLPDEAKCEIDAGVYPVSNRPFLNTNGHYKVKFANEAFNCPFLEGYVFEGHGRGGAVGLSTWTETVFKKTPKQSQDLPESHKCILPVGTFAAETIPQPQANGHYMLQLRAKIPECAFQTGYVYHEHTHFADPNDAPKGIWEFPLAGGSLGSRWCVCRNIGTSPHIGQDFVKSGTRKSVAVNFGVIESISFAQTCGYFVYFRDQGGGLWRYMHLNRPDLYVGQSLAPGDLIGYHSKYPRSGCGTGPHLHLERRSAGSFKDRIQGKTCQFGYRSCYFDPVKPWRGSFSSVEWEAAEDARNEHQQVQKDLAIPIRPCLQAHIARPVSELELADFVYTEQHGIGVEAEFHRHHDEWSNKSTLRGSVELVMGPYRNRQNTCSSAPEKDCIINMRILYVSQDGQFRPLFQDTALRNRRFQLTGEEGVCLPDDADGKIILAVKTIRGRALRHEIVLD